MTNLLTLSLLFTLFTNLTFSKVQNTKIQMQDILKTYTELIPYIYRDKKMNDGVFLKRLSNFEKSLKNSDHLKFLTQENFDPNLKIIKDSLTQYKESVKMKNFYFAKRGLKTIATKCISCHSQLPSQKFGKISSMYSGILNTEIKSSYDQAMMAYLLRNYDLAIKKFSTAVKEYKHDPQVQSRSIRKIIKISMMNKRDTTELLSTLNTFKAQVNMNSYLGENLNDWIKQISSFKIPETKNVGTLTKNILIPIETEVRVGSPMEFMVPLHFMQGVLSRHLSMATDSKFRSESLYWLGLIENSFHEDFMFSLGEMYLKKCITNYPKDKVAKKCYKALEESYTMGFTGSSGTSIPSEIQFELNELKKLIK